MIRCTVFARVTSSLYMCVEMTSDVLDFKCRRWGAIIIIVLYVYTGVNPWHTTNSKVSFWPLIFTVMNLPKYIRNKSDALILYGLVPSKTKVAGEKGIEPELLLYQEMMVDELLTLTSIDIHSAYAEAPITVKIEVLLYMLDFQGYSKYFSMSGAVSYRPCNVCTIRSTRVDQKMVILGHRSYDAASLKRDYKREVCNNFITLVVVAVYILIIIGSV